MEIKIKITRKENADYFSVAIGDIVEVELEEYVAAVVASEIGNSNIEACKAQAVAARTYAVHAKVLEGKVISDDSAVAQAYRAPRFNSSIYPNCIKAAKDTMGEIVTYNNKPANTVYSACNGGKTVSCEEKWGNFLPYLIQQDDNWDLNSGKTKRGHGVGMSQEGAIWAGAHNYNYKTILKFYYPKTSLTNINPQLQINKNHILDLKNKLLEIDKKIGEV